MAVEPVAVGVVGFGYWGPRLIRNFQNADSTRTVGICDQEKKRRELAKRGNPSIPVFEDFDHLLALPELEAVAIATPVETHHSLARKALIADKHVFVEKPFTRTSVQGRELIDIARERKRIIMVDHTFLYTAAVRKLHEIVSQGQLGTLLYYDSIRINLGLFQPDVDVVWDLAPHDLYILDHVVSRRPIAISVIGASHSSSGHTDVAYVTLKFDDNFLAHVHLNWLAPMKVRQILIGGSKSMVQYNDVLPDEKIRIYDRGIETALPSTGTITVDDREGRYQNMISYRTGDMHAPWLDRTEALFSECNTFGQAVREGFAAINDGVAGLRVVLMLEAASKSLKENGNFVPIDWSLINTTP